MSSVVMEHQPQHILYLLCIYTLYSCCVWGATPVNIHVHVREEIDVGGKQLGSLHCS